MGYKLFFPNKGPSELVRGSGNNVIKPVQTESIGTLQALIPMGFWFAGQLRCIFGIQL